MELSLEIPCPSPTSSCIQSPTTPTSQHSISSPSVGHKQSKEWLHHASHHTVDSFFSMDLMRKQKLLCDVILKVEDKTIPAHRLVLASCSPYFHAMFTNEMAECFKSEVTLHDIDANAVELLVEFAYTSVIKITEENVQYLLPAASLLQLHSVRDACCRFLATQLSPSNCLGIRRFADTHGCFDLETSSKQFVLQNFNRVVDAEEFGQLNFEEVEELVSSEELVVAEEDAFVAITKWISNDQSKRKKYIYSLVRHIRLPLTSRDFVAQYVACHPLVHTSPECKDLVIEAMKYHLLPDQRTSLQSPRTIARRHSAATPMLFAMGGGSLFAIHSDCECYNSKTQTWMPISAMNVKRARLGVAAVGSHIFAIGGYDGSNDVSVVEKYSTQTNSWSQVSSMGTRRSCLGVVMCNGLIYAVGGYDGASCLNTAERYDPLTDTWTSIAAMTIKRRYVKLAVVDNFIFAVGGYDGSAHLSSIEKYNPVTNTWTMMPAMISPRSSMGVAVLEGRLHVFGGNDGGMCLSNGEIFNSEISMWEPFPSMGMRRSTHDAVTMDGDLYVIGGNDGSSSLNSVERYDSKLHLWEDLPPMSMRRSSVGVAVAEVLNPEIFSGH